MFKNFISAYATFTVAHAKTTIMSPPTPDLDAADVALIFIHGMSCDPVVYQPLAEEFQDQMNKAKYPAKMWVAFPEFPFDAPNPITISHYVKEAEKDLKAAGFTGTI